MSTKRTRSPEPQPNLFQSSSGSGGASVMNDAVGRRAPLADRMRPRSLEEYVGQRHVLAPGKLLRRAIEADRVRSLILYGPPGTGKTTLAQVIAHHSRATFRQLNAVLAGVKVLREEVESAQRRLERFAQPTLLFVDEIHRFNQAQQDALLPWVERGVITLIGATTENPYFEVNAALNSRSHIFQLRELDEVDLIEVAIRALSDEARGLGREQVALEPHALAHWVNVVNGDARALLNALELAVETTPPTARALLDAPPRSLGDLAREALQLSGAEEVTDRGFDSLIKQIELTSPKSPTGHHDETPWKVISLEVAEASIQERAIRYDAHGDEHFDTLSAYIKSLRGSDPDAALYWLAKMIYAGEPARVILRRLLIFASEDVGLAWPEGVGVVNACAQAFDRVGMPEGRFHLAHATLAMATAPKSNSTLGFFDALASVANEGASEIPSQLKDPSRDGDTLGHGVGYLYPHAYQNHWVAQQHLPTALIGRVFYQPSRQGEERAIGARVHRLREAQLEGIAQGEPHPLIEMSDPDERRIEEWSKRAEGAATLRWSEARDELKRHAQLRRGHVTLDLNAGAGLFTWSAVRHCLEGGVYSWCQTLAEAEQLSAQAQGLPWAHRPVVGYGDWSALEEWEPLRELPIDRVIGRDVMRIPTEWTPRLTWIAARLRPGGRITLSERHPQGAQRLSALSWSRPLNHTLHQRWKSAEDSLYLEATHHSDSKLWGIDSLRSHCENLCEENPHLTSALHVHSLSWRSRLTSREVDRWCDLAQPHSYLSQLTQMTASARAETLSWTLSQEEAQAIYSFLRSQVGSWLTWREERVIMTLNYERDEPLTERSSAD